MLSNSFHKWLAYKKKRLLSTFRRYEQKNIEDSENISCDLVIVCDTEYLGTQHYYGHHINQLHCDKTKIVSDNRFILDTRD